MPRRQAAFQGAQEIGFAVVAMTITLAAVYAPVAFMTGRTGKLFVEFALTLAGAVLVSGFVALTLSPMMCSLLLKHETRHGKAYVRVENFLNWVTAGYRRVLTAALARRWLVMLAFALVAGANVLLLGALKSELAPIEDRGVILGVFLGPEGATLDYTEKYATQLQNIYAQTADVERYFVVAGNPTVSQGISFVGLATGERTAQLGGGGQGAVPEVHGHPGRAGLSGAAAVARAESARAAGQFRHRHLGVLRRARADDPQDPRRGGEESRASPTSIPTSS
jgi:multidrug efflux pump